VELQYKFASTNQLRQLRQAYQLEFDSQLGWFAFGDRAGRDEKGMHPVRQPCTGRVGTEWVHDQSGKAGLLCEFAPAARRRALAGIPTRPAFIR
jgi:hypothetical protein